MSSLFPNNFPETGIGEGVASDLLQTQIDSLSTNLGSAEAFAHMDPPPPKIAVDVTRWNAEQNQNLLHPDLSPLASQAEKHVINWLLDDFGMGCGHMCGGSTLANITALWAAREHGATRVITSADAHLSIRKAAHILGLPCHLVDVDSAGKIDADLIPALTDAALVLTAGTTGRGAIDPLLVPDYAQALWIHVDAAWAGPLRMTRYRSLLDGIETADSVAISAHKWFFQPKDSAICLFKTSAAQDSVSFSSSYLARPNVGIQGSRSAAGLTLLATLLAWGREGLDVRLHTCMTLAEDLATHLQATETVTLRSWPETGVVNWRPNGGVSQSLVDMLKGVASTVTIDGETWMRNVAANPYAQLDDVVARVCEAVQRCKS